MQGARLRRRLGWRKSRETLACQSIRNPRGPRIPGRYIGRCRASRSHESWYRKTPLACSELGSPPALGQVRVVPERSGWQIPPVFGFMEQGPPIRGKPLRERIEWRVSAVPDAMVGGVHDPGQDRLIDPNPEGRPCAGQFGTLDAVGGLAFEVELKALHRFPRRQQATRTSPADSPCTLPARCSPGAPHTRFHRACTTRSAETRAIVPLKACRWNLHRWRLATKP